MKGQNYTNFERNLAMMVIYLPVKFEFDWTNRFRVRVRKRKIQTDIWTDGQTDVGHINLIGGLVTRNPPKKYLWLLNNEQLECALKLSNLAGGSNWHKNKAKNEYKN